MAFALEPSAHFSCSFRQDVKKMQCPHRAQHSTKTQWLLQTFSGPASEQKASRYDTKFIFEEQRHPTFFDRDGSWKVLKKTQRFSRETQRMIPERFVNVYIITGFQYCSAPNYSWCTSLNKVNRDYSFVSFYFFVHLIFCSKGTPFMWKLRG